MTEVIKYKCDYCGLVFPSRDICLGHEEKHIKQYEANKMLKSGHTLKEIQDEYNIWHELPEYLNNVTKDNCFVIPYCQYCNRPAYKIYYISISGLVYLYGCGSWSGYYGEYLTINDENLKDPRPKEELFIDQNYEKYQR